MDKNFTLFMTFLTMVLFTLVFQHLLQLAMALELFFVIMSMYILSASSGMFFSLPTILIFISLGVMESILTLVLLTLLMKKGGLDFTQIM